MKNIELPAWVSQKATPDELQFIEKRISEMSVKEIIQFNAAMRIKPPETPSDIINLSFRLTEYEMCYGAGNDLQLGEYVAKHSENIKAEAMDYLDKDKLGQIYRERHPGVFYEGSYVIPPKSDTKAVYDGSNISVLKDDDWSVKLKLATDRNPEGVWVRLPCYCTVNGGEPGEIDIALDVLGVESASECRILEAVCILSGISGLMEQYDSTDKLIWDGNNLGYIMDEAGQGQKNWREHFMAALEYENCERLDFALDISQNLRCYDFLLDDAAVRAFGREKAISNGLVLQGSLLAEAFDYSTYGHKMAENEGMQLTEYGYIGRNYEKFIYDHSLPPGQQICM